MEQNKWWKDNVSKDPQTFKGWLGNSDALDRKIVRDRVIGKYKSVLDCACGFAEDAFHYKGNGIEYRGIDSTPYLVEDCRARGFDVIEGSIEKIPFFDNQFDVVMGRHILEHLEGYKKAIKEMIRCARYEVIITLFIPLADKTLLAKDKNLNEQVYLNTYGKKEILGYIKLFKRVESVEILNDDTILCIRLKSE